MVRIFHKRHNDTTNTRCPQSSEAEVASQRNHICITHMSCLLYFFNATATTEIYTLSLHDALPIFDRRTGPFRGESSPLFGDAPVDGKNRSEEHTSELQSRVDLVCRLLLEKKK